MGLASARRPEAARNPAVLIAAAGRPASVDALLLATYGDDAGEAGKATLDTDVSVFAGCR